MKNISLLIVGSLFSVSALSNEVIASNSGSIFDPETSTYVLDSDLDSFPDKTEIIGGTNPLDGQDYPGAEEALALETQGNDINIFPGTSCRSGFRLAGARLCISTTTQNATRYDTAQARCRAKLSHVASYEDLFYLYLYSSLDASYNPNGKWIGNMIDDDDAFVGNRTISYNNDPDIWNFEGHANKSNSRAYWCAHDKL
ncbi:hypothetical protein [Aliikangiella coralliicola]|uniref:C-type lectin domain-containing protein n=1 Tax=Aliikangiella coralliicola TaxID=2592383 RepID=A0A545UEH7_9GAMM|nr:hypothetical protein [Aliikangiella coralliicola]TQV87793.1 hypothetical protein FLL46_10425 [Aliikangiella coralliicola]